MMELKCFRLTKGSIKRMAFEFVIKTFLPVHCWYNKEDKPGSGCLILCTAILDWGCPRPRLLRQQEWRDSQKQKSQNFSTYVSLFCCWLNFPIAYSAMTKQVSMSFSIKYVNLFLLALQRGVTGTARILHALTHSSISRQVREQM